MVLRNILFCLALLFGGVGEVYGSQGGQQPVEQQLTEQQLVEQYSGEPKESEEFDIQELIFEHLGDSYSWHIATYKGRHIEIHLLCIVRSSSGGWHFFSSKHVSHGDTYKGFYVSTSEKYDGKLVEVDSAGEEYRPIDLSVTKNAFALLVSSLVMMIIFLSVGRWYRKRTERDIPRGFIGAVEMLVMSIEDDVIRKCVGKDYKRYSPYLLTIFFFILINNILGLVPIFPFGANTTGNIAVTLFLALCTTVAINVFGNKEYWKEILWPDVPIWMKVPIPLMPIIEIFGVIAKPFALTVRLFANIMAGHTIVLALTCLVFITAQMGVAISTGMSIFSVFLSIFMLCLELLVAYIQAYVFTMLSAIFIGFSRKHHTKQQQTKTIKTNN